MRTQWEHMVKLQMKPQTPLPHLIPTSAPHLLFISPPQRNKGKIRKLEGEGVANAHEMRGGKGYPSSLPAFCWVMTQGGPISMACLPSGSFHLFTPGSNSSCRLHNPAGEHVAPPKLWSID